MHVARLIIVFFFVLVLMVAWSPQMQRETSQAWVAVRPALVEFMDALYATIRNFVAGTESDHGIDDHPPGTNYDFIITMNQGDFF